METGLFRFLLWCFLVEVTGKFHVEVNESIRFQTFVAIRILFVSLKGLRIVVGHFPAAISLVSSRFTSY